MADFFRSARAALTRELERLRNRQFLEATMAASALVVMADGELKFSELNTIDRLRESIRELKSYDAHVAVDLCRDYADAIGEDFERGKASALSAVTKLAGDQEAGRLVMQMCIAIAKSDGDFSASELALIRELCHALGLDPSDMGL